MRTTIGVIAIGLLVVACGSEDHLTAWGSNGATHGDDAGSAGDDSTGDDGTGDDGSNTDGGTTPTGDGGTKPTGDSGGTTPTGDSGGTTSPTSTTPFATNITIAEVAMFQTVKVSLAKAGATVSSRTANVIENRDGLLRVYVTPGSGFTSKSLTAQLSLVVNGAAQPLLSDTKTISAASTDASINSTFNFAIPGASLPAGVSYTVAITDPSISGTRAPGSNPAQYPATGTPEDMLAHNTGPQLKVMIVPFQYAADGSQRLPDTTPAQLELYRQAFYGIYPAAKVVISVHAPFAFSSAISASGSGFSTALTALVNLRQQDNVSADLYYMGVFAPSASFNSYCGSGCVTGLSGVGTSASDANVRASVGIGFTGTESSLTAAHEVGHAHGRQHAPCGGAAGPDPNFPYSTGGIGVWGYNLNTKALIDPSTGKDLMGYCSPEWISDYNYAALTTRMAAVNGVHKEYDPNPWLEPRAFRFLSVEADGSATWGEPTIVRTQPRGVEHTITFKNAAGAIIGAAAGYFYEYGDLPGGFMFAPEPPAGTVTTTVAGPAASTTVRRAF